MPPSSTHPAAAVFTRLRRFALLAVATAAAASCGSDPTGPSRDDLVRAFQAVVTRANQRADAKRSSAAGMALSALRLGAPLTTVTLTRDGRTVRMTAVVARHDATLPDYEPGISQHITNLLAWDRDPSRDLLWVAFGDSVNSYPNRQPRGGYESTENTGALVMFVSLMPAGDLPALAGGYGEPARASVAVNGASCDAIGAAADALHPTVGIADCRGADFTLAFRSTLFPDIGTGPPTTLDLDTTVRRGVWFRLYCEGFSCPSQFPGAE